MMLHIKIPATYSTDKQKVYPCWYFTDANLAFPVKANMAGFFEIPVITEPELFVVGIAYKIKDVANWGARRTRDLTPTNISSTDTFWSGLISKMADRQVEIKTGGPERFLEFIVQEVFPFMESNYRVSQEGRGPGGYPCGGLFSLMKKTML
jgi:predicted alpha/beta superfamily hydrolase